MRGHVVDEALDKFADFRVSADEMVVVDDYYKVAAIMSRMSLARRSMASFRARIVSFLQDLRIVR